MSRVTFTLTVTDRAGHATSRTVDVQRRMLLGMSGALSTEWQSYLSSYGAANIKYTRDFGKDNLYQVNGAYDADTYTEWTKWGTGKWVGADPTMVNHLSVKDDADEYLDPWAATFPPTNQMPAGFRGVAASPWHEAWDDVNAGTITWAWLQQQGRDIVSWRNRHPRGKELIRAIGPILTRYDLVDKSNDPTNAGFAGMTHFFFDTYQSDTNAGRYYTPAEMIDAPAARIQAKYPGIPMGIPEAGWALQSGITNANQARADAIKAAVDRCRARGDIDFFSYFNSVGSIASVPFGTTGPEADMYRTLLTTQ